MKIWKNVKLRFISILIVLFVIETIFVGRSFTAASNSVHDSSLFAYMGQMVNDGLRLYSDVWDIKPPGIFWVNALVASITTSHFFALALLEATVLSGSVFCVYLILKHLQIDRHAIVFSVLSCAILLNLQFYNQGGNLTEIYLSLPMTLSILCFIIAWQKKLSWLFILSGLTTSIATLFKLPGLSPYLAQITFIFFLVMTRDIYLKESLKIILLLTLGLIIPWGTTIFYFYNIGGLNELINVSFLYPFMYGSESQLSILQVINRLIKNLQPTYSLIPLALTTAILTVVNVLSIIKNSAGSKKYRSTVSTYNKLYLLVLLWLAADLSGAIAGGRYYNHYFLAVIPSLCIVAGIGLNVFFNKNSFFGNLKPAGKFFVSLVIIYPLIHSHVIDVATLHSIHKSSATQSSSILITYINETKENGDLLFVWDYRTDIYLKTNLRPASRYLTSVNLDDSVSSRTTIGGQLISDLQNNKPRFVVTNRMIFFNDAPLQPISGIFSTWLLDNYQLEINDESLQLYTLK